MSESTNEILNMINEHDDTNQKPGVMYEIWHCLYIKMKKLNKQNKQKKYEKYTK